MEYLPQKAGFGQSRNYGQQVTGAAMNLSVGQVFKGQPDLLHMIEIVQKARQAELVRALYKQYRVLLCAPAGVAPGDKEWHDTLKKFMTKIGTIKTESQIPALCFLIFMALK